jgi:GT2 family glycosyltransferase
MLLSGDGSSKQRGHFCPPSEFAQAEEVFFPSACAALYRRNMLDEIGLFDEEFFLYCEDTDLGLRARWSGWNCLYVPNGIVDHRYSHSAGRASRLKAYLVERNRLPGGAQSATGGREKFSFIDAIACTFYIDRSVLLARRLDSSRRGSSVRV